MKVRAIVLASGGMDSCVTATLAAEEYKLAMLHVQYGQRTQLRELRAFNEIADHLNAEHRLVTNLDHLTKIGGSSLTDKKIKIEEADLQADHVPNTYVPFRNAHLLAIATSWAEVLGATRIFFGAVEEDSSGYPDCRSEFVDAYNRLIEQGTKPDTHIQIETPLIRLSKKEIVELGTKKDAPLHLTWSCYRGNNRACGHCDSCALRLRGFYQAGLTDPISYADGTDRDRFK